MAIHSFDVGYAEMPFQGNPPCGDAWYCRNEPERLQLMALDAIGHGHQAHAIATFAIAEIERITGDPFRAWSVEDSLLMLDRKMRSRGNDYLAAVALFNVQRATGTLSGGNVGNLEAYLLNEEGIIHLHATNGMIGGVLPSRINIFEQSLAPGSCLVIHSDGISSTGMRQFLKELQTSRMFLSRSADQLAAQAVHLFGKSHDDASCAILRVL
jgi:serine phosphatase RsbU (regulator of sigma subunit)